MFLHSKFMHAESGTQQYTDAELTLPTMSSEPFAHALPPKPWLLRSRPVLVPLSVIANHLFVHFFLVHLLVHFSFIVLGPRLPVKPYLLNKSIIIHTFLNTAWLYRRHLLARTGLSHDTLGLTQCPDRGLPSLIERSPSYASNVDALPVDRSPRCPSITFQHNSQFQRAMLHMRTFNGLHFLIFIFLTLATIYYDTLAHSFTHLYQLATAGLRHPKFPLKSLPLFP